MNAPAILDLFAGPGGWDTGLRMVGRSDVRGIEWDAAACATGRAAGHERLQADITELDPATVGGTSLEGLIASPPCGGFSPAGKGRGRADAHLLLHAVGEIAAGRDPRGDLHAAMADDRSVLALEPLRWALDLRPEWSAWEQVPAVLPLWEACAEALRADGYATWVGVVQAEQYGVPQTRRRAVLLASRRAGVGRPPATHSRYYPHAPGKLDAGVLRWVPMATALGWGMRKRPAMTVAPGADAFGNGAHLGMLREIAAGQWAYRTSTMPRATTRTLDQPAPTVAFGNDANSVGWVSGADIMRITVEEAACLQTFPDDYPWRGTKGERFRQVGDAVPPLLAAHCLQTLGVGQLATERAA